MRSIAKTAAESVVVTGIGLVTANGYGRESVWEATRSGVSGIRRVDEADFVFPHPLKLAAKVNIEPEFPDQLKSIRLARFAAEEAMFDSKIDLHSVDRNRFGCAISGNVGDVSWWSAQVDPTSVFANREFNSEQWLPNCACWDVATRFGLNGPRYSHSTACASGLIEILTAARAIRDGQADIALAGSAECIDPVFAAGFNRMRVLANDDDPAESCLPFDKRRHGFVMGEGAGMLVIERLDHAVARGAKIYAELVAGKMMADAHHVTSLDVDSDVLVRLISDTMRKADVEPADIAYVNAHGTGTEQNDLIESRGIRNAFKRAADDVCVSSLKSMLGHLVNASGSVELALTILGMRDGYAPPTLNLRDRDPRCDLDFVPMQARSNRFEHAMKLSLAFGGHLVATVVRRWNNLNSGGIAYPDHEETPKAA